MATQRTGEILFEMWHFCW